MGFTRFSLPALAALALSGAVAGAALAAPDSHRHHAGAPAPVAKDAKAGAPSAQDEDAIVAIVNGQIITRRDVDARGRLFTLSTGQPMSQEILDRLKPQIIRQLVDEKLRMQEIQRLHINVPTDAIAKSIADIESRNGMQKNALRDKLAADGVSMTTLIDQIRVQLAWSGVLREQLGDRSRVTSADIRQRQAALKREEGEPEYLVSEIFVPVDDPKNSGDALKFTETIIQQLRNGAPFPIVAAQFSQAQTALEGGSLGWVHADNLDPEVVEVAKQMPIGAISNPIRVAGGYAIITLGGRRAVGRDMATMLSLRQAFIPFTSTLNPAAPTPQQEQALQQATALSANAKSCDDIVAANKRYGEKRPSDPGDLDLARLNPQMAGVLKPLPVGKATHPLVSTDGIDIIMICSRSEKNMANQGAEAIADQLLNDRVEMVSRQINRDLHRKATIVMRSTS